VLSLGDSEDRIEPLLATRRRQAAGELTGAHLYATGRTIANHIRIETVAEVEPYLDLLQSRGFEYVKTHNEIPRDVFDAVVAGARRRGMGVFGQMPRNCPPEYTLSHGVNVIAHMEEFFFTFFAGPRDAALESMQPDWTREYSRIDPILDIAARNDVAIIPNLVASDTFQNLWVDESRTLDLPDLASLAPEGAAICWRTSGEPRRSRESSLTAARSGRKTWKLSPARAEPSPLVTWTVGSRALPLRAAIRPRASASSSRRLGV
jgi:hypothetical protein